LKTQFTTSWSLPSATMTVALQKMVSPSDLREWRKPYTPSARWWPVWGPKTIIWLHTTNWNTVSPNNCQLGNMQP
jgi:hypothetical protein